MSTYFRFEDLEIWEEAIHISMILLDIADMLDEKKLWRLSDQVRGVAMGIPNNIAESTGSNMVKEQRLFLRYSRRECFEAANILVILQLRNFIRIEEKVSLYHRLSDLCRRNSKYSDSLE